MQVSQVYEIMNAVTRATIGETELLAEDLSNIVDVGNSIMNTAGIENYVRSLTDHIGKTIFVNRAYSGSVPSVLMDGWEFGSILEKVSYDDLPEATENESWKLEDGKSYDVNVFTQPKASAKFFNKRVTFEVPMSFAERQVKSAFDSAAQLNAFFSMIHNAIDKSMTVKVDGLVSRTINNMIGETVFQSIDSTNGSIKGVKAVNLLSSYNKKFGTSLKAANCIYDPEFIRYASLMIRLYSDRLTKLSKLFNIGGKDRFTSKDLQHIVLLSEFEAYAEAYLYSDTFHKEFTALPNAEKVAYWQGSGKNYDFSSTSRINIISSSGTEIAISGILGIIFDRDALGVCNLDRRVTTNYNAKGEFFNNWYKFDAGYFNDFNENFVVFLVDDELIQ